MAIIDETKGVLVIRIVYDGPALSGKTTSVRALARGVSSKVVCPEELAGRTLFFDWMEYVGGLFEGRQISCQIVSAPGQRELASRRKLLLESADAVVLVLDTRRAEWDFALGWVRDTVGYCRTKDPPVGLVLQANKRDAPDAVTLQELREGVNRIAPLAVVPSTATNGDGIREAFVFAVRLALDRVRALAHGDRLGTGKPDESDAGELLARMRRLEPDRSRSDGEFAFAGSLEAELAPWVPAAEHASPEREPTSERAFVPDPMMPGGMIWPPVDGRALLHEVSALGIQPTRTSRADWCGSGSGFRFHSFARAIFDDLSSARNELIEWARQHSANAAHLSTGRAVILADAGHGNLRLWQIVRAEATLRERLAAALGIGDAQQAAAEVLAVATQLVLAREALSTATVQLPCTLWSVGASSSYRPTFVGLMPYRASAAPEEPNGRALLERELSAHLRELRRARVDFSEVVAGVVVPAERAAPHTPARWLADIILQI